MTEKPKNMPGTGFTETLADGFTFEMVFVEGGNFLMGSDSKDGFYREDPIHEVKLDSFYLGKFPVTQALWKAVMGNDNNPSSFKGDSRPVETVPWEEAQRFIHRLNEITGKAYRLPTEAEWEYAARGGQKSEGYRYAGSTRLKEVGWFRDNSYGETKPVGMKAPNELGLYDMSGNVLEWCWDWFDENYYEECHEKGTVENPKGPAQGTIRVVRGGSWDGYPQDCRCTYRYGGAPEDRYASVGFRLVLPFQFNP